MARGFVVRVWVNAGARVDPGTFHLTENSYTFSTWDKAPTIDDISAFDPLIGSGLWKSVFALLPSRYFWGNLFIEFPLVTPLVSVKFPVQAYAPRLSETLPLSDCLRVNLRTGKRGRPFRGHKLIGPLCQEDVQDDLLTPTALTQWRSATAAFGSTFLGVRGSTDVFTLSPVIWSRQLTGGGDGSGFGEVEEVTSVEVVSTVGRLRHRRPKVTTA